MIWSSSYQSAEYFEHLTTRTRLWALVLSARDRRSFKRATGTPTVDARPGTALLRLGFLHQHHPPLRSCITQWGATVLAFKSSSINITLTSYEASILRSSHTPTFPSLASRCAQLDPIVLAQHLFHIQDHDLGFWVRLLETAAQLLEVFIIYVGMHHPGARHDVTVPLPCNFLATHLYIHRVNVNNDP